MASQVPGGGEPLPKSPRTPVPAEPSHDGGLHDGPTHDPHRSPRTDDRKPVTPEPPTGPDEGAPARPVDSEGDAIHLEDDRIR